MRPQGSRCELSGPVPASCFAGEAHKGGSTPHRKQTMAGSSRSRPSLTSVQPNTPKREKNSSMQHETDVTVNLDPHEAGLLIRALAAEVAVQTGRGEDADYFREQARAYGEEIARLVKEIAALKSELEDALELNVELSRQVSVRHADLHVSDPGGGQ